MKHLYPLTLGLGLALIPGSANAVTYYADDLVASGSADVAISFEEIVDSTYPDVTYEVQDVRVRQVNTSALGVVSDFNPGGADGFRSWYPNGSDNGYTSIRAKNGKRMQSVALLAGHGNSGTLTAMYELRLDGAIVAQGMFDNTSEFAPATFTNAVFDELRLRNLVQGLTGTTSFRDGTPNSLAVDNIEVVFAPE